MGDQGVWRGSWRATQRGAWQGIAASGREVRWTVIIIGRFGFVALVSIAASGNLGFGVTVVVTVASAEPFPWFGQSEGIFRGLLTSCLEAYDRFVGIRNGVSVVCSQEAPWSAVVEGPEAWAMPTRRPA